MCESHVSNPQTVGKCCSLLNSLPPFSSLPRSPFLSGSLSWRALCPPFTVQVCVCVCARVPARLPGRHTGSERGTSASAALPGTAASCRQFLCQPAHARAHARTQILARRPPRLPVRKKKTQQDSQGGGEAALSPFLFGCLYLYPVCLFLLEHKL